MPPRTGRPPQDITVDSYLDRTPETAELAAYLPRELGSDDRDAAILVLALNRHLQPAQVPIVARYVQIQALRDKLLRKLMVLMGDDAPNNMTVLASGVGQFALKQILNFEKSLNTFERSLGISVPSREEHLSKPAQGERSTGSQKSVGPATPGRRSITLG